MRRISWYRVKYFLANVLAVASVVLQAVISPAQVPTSITSSGLGTVVTPNGNIHDITGGTRRGTNLFHSFGLFNVGTNDIANFLNDTGAATNNILGRVNGGQASQIFGTIRTTGFGPANLFLINPFGWIFGPSATLDVGGSFHVSTADYLKFSDGTFFADNSPLPASGLTANPVAFGFLGSPLCISPCISVTGSVLQVPDGRTLSLVGGDVQITGDPNTGAPSILSAPSGRIQIGSFLSAGEATVDGLSGTFASLGRVEISGGSFISTTDVEGDPSIVNGGSVLIRGEQVAILGASIDVSGIQTFDADFNLIGGTAGGAVVIRGGRLLVDSSFIRAGTLGNVDGAPVGIDIRLADNATLTNGTLLVTETTGLGGGGDIRIAAASLSMDGAASVLAAGSGAGRAGDISGIFESLALTDGASFLAGKLNGTAGGGNLIINATRDIVISNGSGIFSSAFPSEFGQIGGITISANGMTIDNGFISAKTVTAANAGDISVNVGSLNLTRGGQIDSNTFGPGRGGNVTVRAANSVSISGQESGLFSKTSSAGNAGQVTVSTPDMAISDGGTISVATSGAGNAGNIALDVGNLTQKGGARVESNTTSAGQGGNVTVAASGSVSISGPDTGLFSTASSEGAGGNVIVQAANIKILNGGLISASSTGTATATAGNVNIVVGDTLRMDGGTITTDSTDAAGGNINITSTGSLLHLTNSQITTSVSGGAGGGGNITIGAELVDPVEGTVANIHPFDFFVLNNSGIHADSRGGAGGKINIFADIFLSSIPVATAVTASSGVNQPGTIDIQATVTEFTSDVSQLPDVPLQATEMLRATCAARVAAGSSSSFVLAGRGGLPLEPGGLLPSPIYLGADSAISLDHHGRPGERLTFSPSNFSILASDNERPRLHAGWDQFQLAKTTLGLDCAQ